LLYEEAPAAYKNIEAVVQDLVEAGLVSVIATFRPIRAVIWSERRTSK
jgi:release factor H-coupled RctB family protein